MTDEQAFNPEEQSSDSPEFSSDLTPNADVNPLDDAAGMPQDEAEAVDAGGESFEVDGAMSAEGKAAEFGGDQGAVGVVNPEDVPEDDAEAAMLAMLEGLPDDEDGASADDINIGSSTSASKAEFQQLQQPSASNTPQNIDLLMDVDLPVSIELGRTKMTIADILSLGPGSVVELNKLAGESVDLLVNYKVVAKGEVVVVDENFGLRITQLMTPEERLKALAEE